MLGNDEWKRCNFLGKIGFRRSKGIIICGIICRKRFIIKILIGNYMKWYDKISQGRVRGRILIFTCWGMKKPSCLFSDYRFLKIWMFLEKNFEWNMAKLAKSWIWWRKRIDDIFPAMKETMMISKWKVLTSAQLYFADDSLFIDIDWQRNWREAKNRIMKSIPKRSSIPNSIKMKGFLITFLNSGKIMKSWLSKRKSSRGKGERERERYLCWIYI